MRKKAWCARRTTGFISDKNLMEPSGGIAWKNGYDFCRNYLTELAAEKKQGWIDVIIADITFLLQAGLRKIGE